MPFGSTSTGSSSTSSPYAGPLGQMGKTEFGIAKPLMSTLGSQFLEALKTGGVNSFLPWITRALDASRQSSSQGLEGARQKLAQTGLGGSSFGQQELSAAKTDAGNQANQIPANMIMQFLQGAPQFALGLGSQASGNYAAAGGLDNTTQTTSTPSFWSQFMQGLQGGGQIAAAYAGG